MDDVTIRSEAPEDAEQIHEVNALAFGRAAEAALVEALRRSGAVTLSLVAVRNGRIVGHILYSPVELVREGATLHAAGLGPMAVRPDQQRARIGSRQVRASLERLGRGGHGGVIVLGHPDYYPRFGFERASRFGLRWEHPCPDEAFLALELRPGALGRGPGVVRYRPEFAQV